MIPKASYMPPASEYDLLIPCPDALLDYFSLEIQQSYQHIWRGAGKFFLPAEVESGRHWLKENDAFCGAWRSFFYDPAGDSTEGIINYVPSWEIDPEKRRLVPKKEERRCH